jgi:DNA polymerase-3 subunit delta
MKKIARKKSAASISPLAMQRNLLDAAKKGLEKPVYLFYGDERYIVEDTAKRLIDELLPDKEQREFGLEVLSGTEVMVAEISTAMGTLPLFGGRRVVWLRRCGLFRSYAKAGSDEGYSKRADAVSAHLPQEAQEVKVIITEETVDKRLTLYKQIKARGLACEFNIMSEKDDRHLRSIYEFVTGKLKADGKEITRDELFYLIQLVGTELHALLTELEKLALHADQRRRISRDDINLLVSPTRETVAYQLSDAIASRNLKASLLFLRRLLGQNEDPLRILGALLKRVRFMLQARDLMEAGLIKESLFRYGYPLFRKSFNELPPSIREVLSGKNTYNLFTQHPYVAFKICEAVQRVPLDRLREELDLVVRTDRELKGGARSKSEKLEDLVISLCS